MKKQRLLVSLLLMMLFVSACTAATQTPAAQPGSADPSVATPAGGVTIDETSPVVVAAKTALSEQLGVSEDQINFVAAEATQWMDSCLGLGGPAESCLQALTPGYRLTFNAAEINYEVRTNEDGSAIRINTP